MVNVIISSSKSSSSTSSDHFEHVQNDEHNHQRQDSHEYRENNRPLHIPEPECSMNLAAGMGEGLGLKVR
jgi:hypothetical protein